MKKSLYIVFIASVILLSNGCSAGSLSSDELEATLAVALEQTISAQPTFTEAIPPTHSPTSTITQTETVMPTSTTVRTKTATTQPAEQTIEKSFTIDILDNGWVNYFYPEYGFSISIPPDWQHLDLSANDIDDMFTYANENNPELSSFYSTTYLRNLAASGIKFMAVDSSLASLSAGIPTSVNILVSELPINIKLDDYVALSIQQLEELLNIVTIQNERVELDGIAAEKIIYESGLNDVLGRPQTVVFNQYLILVERTQYVLTLGSVKALADTNEANFSSIVSSLELSQ